jgi:tetratricopeptide (TPR) repeat protein
MQYGAVADLPHFDELGGRSGARTLPFELTEYQPPDGPEPVTAQEVSPAADSPLRVGGAALPSEPDAVDGAAAHAQDLERAAREAVKAGNVKLALRLCRALLKRDADDLEAQQRYALLLSQVGDREEALELLDRCVAHFPANPAVRVNRGAVLANVARYAEAESDLRHALSLDPTNAEGHFNLGLVEVRRGRWGDSIPHFRRAIELDASNAAAHFYLGEALNHIDDIYGAFQAYQRATELHPLNPAAFYGLGIVLDRLGRPEEATQMYRRSREVAAP